MFGCGRAGGELARSGESAQLIPIELLNPGDWVYSHDGKPHQIIKTFHRRYPGFITHIAGDDGNSLWLTSDHLVLTERRVKHLTPLGQWSGIPHQHFARARRMRQNMSPPELAIWGHLRHNKMGVKFRKQHPIGPYIADFYCHEAGLVVEIDGRQHFETEKASAYDRRRNEFMADLGMSVLRISAHAVGANIDGVLGVIHQKARQRTLAEDPSRQWRCAKDLRVGDTIYSGLQQNPIRVKEIVTEQRAEDVYDIQVDDSHSYITELCTVHNCGSGTTAAVAEKLGRKWRRTRWCSTMCRSLRSSRTCARGKGNRWPWRWN